MLSSLALALVQLGPALPVVGNPMNPVEVAVVDVDFDGRLDVVVQGSSSEGVGVAYRTVTGAFGPLVPWVVGTPAPAYGRGRSLAVADIDLDGDMDLLLGGYGGEVVVVLSDDQGGTAQVLQVDVLGARANSVHVADVTADGLPDLIVGSLGAAQSSIYRQAAGGTFGPRESLVVGADVEAGMLEFVDVDGDGDLDALGAGAAMSSMGGSGLVLFRNTAGIPFAPSDVSLVLAGMNALDVGDVDGDGDVDIVACSGLPNRDAFVLPNGGNGAFGNRVTLATDASTLHELRFADVDADGDLDVVARRELQNHRAKIGLFRNGGGGLWSEQLEPLFDADTATFDVADLNGDGAVDAVTGEAHSSLDYSHTRIDVSHGVDEAGERVFALAQALNGRHAVQPVQSIDANGDGRDDLVVVDSDAASISDGNVGCRLALPGGGFGPAVSIVQTGVWADPPVAGDFDGDGIGDVAAVLRGTAQVLTALGRGDGTFDPAVPSLAPLSGPPDSMSTADINGDGMDDLVLTTGNSARVLYAFGQTSGQFSGLMGLPDGAFSQAIDVRPDDLDGDGLIDLVYAVGDDVVWSRNMGGGSLAVRAHVVGFPGATGYELPVPQVADMDGDGRRDLVAVGPQQDLLWSRALGGGSFAPPIALPLPAGSLVRGLALDVDADGDADVVADVGPVPGARVLVFSENSGGATFGPWEQLAAFPFRGAASLTPIDYDGDGDLDVLVGGEDAKFRLARNQQSTELGQRFCAPSIDNSTGRGGRIGAIGSVDLTRNDFRLDAWSLPASSFGYFLIAPQRDSVTGLPNSVGRLCLGGAVGRFLGPGQVLHSGASGAFSLEVDLDRIPRPQLGLVPVQPGETWHFQAWHRDAASGTPTSNFTDGLSVTF